MGLFLKGESSTKIDKRLRSSFFKEIEKFEKDLFRSDNPEKDYEKFEKIANSFFSKALGLNYKFTYEDLKFDAKEKSLPKNVDEKVEILCDTLNEMEFDKQKITKEKLLKTSSLLSDLVDYFSGESILPSPPIIENEKLNEEDIKNKKDEIQKEIEDIELEIHKEEKELKEDNNHKIEKDNNVKKESIFSKLFGKKKKQEIVENTKAPILNHETTDIETSLPEKIEETGFVVQEQSLPSYKEEKKEPEAKIPEQQKNIKDIKEKSHENIKAKQKKSKKDKSTKSDFADKKLQPLKTIEDELPSFNLAASLNKKERKFEKNLEDITRSLEFGKKEIGNEIALIKKEKNILKEEKKKLKEASLSKDKKDLPVFKIFDQKLNTEIKEIDEKKKDLLEKEKEINEKLKAISIMEKNLKELSSNLKKDDTKIKEKTMFLEKKEAVINKIKEELDKKYNHAISEVDNLKKEVKEKETNFIKLQKFYQTRENKLSVEETNLLDDKRKQAKLVSSLLQKHLDIAKKDLASTEKKVLEIIDKNKKTDLAIRDYQKKYEQMIAQKESFRKEINTKKRYFEKLEEDFRAKDPKFDELNNDLDRRLGEIVKRESAIMKFEDMINKSQQEIKDKIQSLEIKEIDLKSIEKDIERLNFDIKNKETRSQMMKKNLEKRRSSFERLRKDIMEDIAKERREIRKIENRLSRKGYIVDKKIKKEEELEKGYDNYHKELIERADLLDEGEELRIDEISIGSSLSESNLANPAVLDILRLLNIAKDFLLNGETERARDAYLEIQRIFEDLDEEDRENLYPEVMRVFKTKGRFSESFSNNSLPKSYLPIDNIDSLLHKFQFMIESGDLNASQQIYSKLQQQYSSLPKEEKGKYYSRIMELYNRVLEQQVSTGVIV